MFFRLRPLFFTDGLILVAAAVLPALLLLWKVYRSDRLEKEPVWLLRKLIRAGILSALLATVLELVLGYLLRYAAREEGTTLYRFLMYFGVVACSEEGAKYLLLKRRTWNSGEFNCQYDGVVYALFVSLGFAMWENVLYVMNYGFQTAVIRALTAIPGHASFGVFMGAFYGLARRQEGEGDLQAASLSRLLAFAVPVLLHGAYDYIATVETSVWQFVIFIGILFVVSYGVVGTMSKKDRYL